MPHPVIARLFGLSALLAVAVAPAAVEPPLAPFQAEYQVLHDGKELGHATLSLRPAGNGTWEFRSETHGTRGMASMLGLDVVEKSTFHWRDGQPEGLQYTYSQQAAMKSRERSIDFDWSAHEARSRDGKRAWTAPLDGPAMDRNLVTVALMAALKSRSADMTFPVVDKDRVSEQSYRVSGDESLPLQSGPVKAMRVERMREENPGKQTTIWFAPQLAWLPVQIEQADKGDLVTLRFVHGD